MVHQPTLPNQAGPPATHAPSSIRMIRAPAPTSARGASDWTATSHPPVHPAPASHRRSEGLFDWSRRGVLRGARAGVVAWIRVHQMAAILLASLLVLAGLAAAILVILQNVTTSPAAKAPLVIFQNGSDYTAINTAGFATLTFGTSSTSATLALSGIAGAASVSLGNVLKLNNQDASHPESVTLSRSTTLNAAITSFQVTVKNGATTLVTWDAVAAASSSAFTLPVSTAADVNILVIVADGTAAGSLGSFLMEFSMTPS